MFRLIDIEIAISKHVCGLREREKSTISVARKLQASPSLEGDSQIGIILFVGVATEEGWDYQSIMDHISIESKKEYDYKLAKYLKVIQINDRFKNKVHLIKNYLKFYGKRTRI